MYDSTFRRVEEKYLISEEEMNKLFEKINDYLEHDKYYESTISNIYFDNLNNDLIVNSLNKPTYKEKIRVRTYSKLPTMDSEVFLEKKDKYNGVEE